MVKNESSQNSSDMQEIISSLSRLMLKNIQIEWRFMSMPSGESSSLRRNEANARSTFIGHKQWEAVTSDN